LLYEGRAGSEGEKKGDFWVEAGAQKCGLLMEGRSFPYSGCGQEKLSDRGNV